MKTYVIETSTCEESNLVDEGIVKYIKNLICTKQELIFL